MSTQKRFDFETAADAHTGFRLHRFEVLNWGTFDRHIWVLPPEGANSLLTGDIGSGKSTLVDGLTTLLVSPQKIVYNKAAGADSRERNLRSYVRGYYKSEKDADSLLARSVALRGDDSYSVLLARFFNAAYDQWVTLAQVFFSRDHRSPPDRFYVVTEDAMGISDAFTGFGADVLGLKKRLRKEKGVRLYDSFTRYAADFSRRMGIASDQALELFYQTVSMKSVGNLTDFVRQHMLEEPPVAPRIEKICRQFDDLSKAHEAVVRARRQVELLTPIAEAHRRYRRLDAGINALVAGREVLHAYFAKKKIVRLHRRLKKRLADLENLEEKKRACRRAIDDMRTERFRLDRAIGESGGRRLEELAAEIARITEDRNRIARKAEAYGKLCTRLNLALPQDRVAFGENRERAVLWRKKLTARRDEILNREVEEKVRLKALGDETAALEAEIASLRKRKTNLPGSSLALRRKICEALNVSDDALPFAGELIRVRKEESAWEGAAERLLHGFALSLLVPPVHYAAVAEFVDGTHLDGRLVYYKTARTGAPPTEGPAADTLPHKLEIKPDTPLYDWLEREVARRFAYTCCESTAAFRRRPFAVTRAGQVKSGGYRHEKDDRHAIDDRSRFVLGWENREKIRLLEESLRRKEADVEKIVRRLEVLDRERKQKEAARDVLQTLLGFAAFEEIHWQPLALRIAQLAGEKRQIEESSDLLATLQAQRESVLAAARAEEERMERILAETGRLEEGRRRDENAREESRRTLAAVPEERRRAVFPELARMQPDALGARTVTVENCEACQTAMRTWLQQRIDNEADKCRRLAEKLVRDMQAYKGRYPVETKEVDAALDAAGEFEQMLASLETEDLPRHEKRFKTMLNEGTIQNIALFQAKLDKELSDIRRKIGVINHSLSAIDYGEGTHISLVADPGPDVEIRQFREDLKACLGHTLTDREDDVYTENKFLQVRALIDRFNGRPGQTDLDRRWTRKVTDVRNWLVFSVSEKWREDGREKEFYSDTAGKSGGQKEKLAYTILASALVYQFGLKWGEKRSRAFRFVMIDEAFGRGSDDSTRYALELFDKLNLQLLIVTPLQKIHIIEDYVRTVHYIHNEAGKNSMVRNLTIEAYREEKAAFQGTAA